MVMYRNMNVTCFIFWDRVQKFKIVNVDKWILISPWIKFELAFCDVWTWTTVLAQLVCLYRGQREEQRRGVLTNSWELHDAAAAALYRFTLHS